MAASRHLEFDPHPDLADKAGRRGNPSQLETDVAECGGTWTPWRVVATDHSCLCVMMMMMDVDPPAPKTPP